MTAPTPTRDTHEPACTKDAAAMVTLVEGPTFCLSNTYGDIVPGTSQGLFFRNTRVLSRWELLVDGHTPDVLSVQTPEPFTGQFILRKAPRAGSVRSASTSSVPSTVGSAPCSGARPCLTAKRSAKAASA